MTVTYTAEVASASVFGCFLKLLARWRGSIYKLIWKDLIIFLIIYYALNNSYRFLMSEEQQKTFQNVVYYCQSYGSLIPLSFVLGFYVSNVMSRWWDQYACIPVPDHIAIVVAAYVCGHDERARMMRRTIMRYACLTLTVVLSPISPRVKRRFPSRMQLLHAGLLLAHEKQVIDDLDEVFPKMAKHWLPMVWASNIVTRARKEGRIRDDFAMKSIIDELNAFRRRCGALTSYDTMNVPLVYTQVVTIAVYSYFACQVVGQQWTGENARNFIDMYFPVFITLQFLFYMGWLKVAESMINPFGDDDDDFEVNWMVDRNLQVSYLIVDQLFQQHPQLYKDLYWDEVLPNELPYRGNTRRDSVPEHSTARIHETKSAKKREKRAASIPMTLTSASTANRKSNKSRASHGTLEDGGDSNAEYELPSLVADNEFLRLRQERARAHKERQERRQADLETKIIRASLRTSFDNK